MSAGRGGLLIGTSKSPRTYAQAYHGRGRLVVGVVAAVVIAASIYVAVSAPAWLLGAHHGGPGGRLLALMSGIWIALTAVALIRPSIEGRPMKSRALIALASLTLVMGTIIFHRGWTSTYLAQRYTGIESIADSVYHTARLFAFKGVDSPPGGAGTVSASLATGWRRVLLWVIVFEAPLVTIGVLLTMVREWRYLRFAMRRRHTVVIGAGQRGLAVLGGTRWRRLREWRRRPIAVDLDSSSRTVAEDLGWDFLQANGRSRGLLRRLGVRKADAVVISTGSKPVNVDIARLATAEAGADGRTVLFHMKDAGLLPREGVDAEPFDQDLVLCKCVNEKLTGETSAVFVVEGSDPFARALILSVARRVQRPKVDDGQHLRTIRLVGTDVLSLRNELMTEPVILASAMEVDAVDVELSRTLVSSAERARLVDAVGRFEPGAAVVAVDDDELGHVIRDVLEQMSAPGLRLLRVGNAGTPPSHAVVDGELVVAATSSSAMVKLVEARREQLVRPLANVAPDIDLRHGLNAYTPRVLEPALEALLPVDADIRGLLNRHACGVPQIDNPELWAHVAERLRERGNSDEQVFTALCESVRSTHRCTDGTAPNGQCQRCARLTRLRDRTGDPLAELVYDMAGVAHGCEEMERRRCELRTHLQSWPNIDQDPLERLKARLDSGARLIMITGGVDDVGPDGIRRGTEILIHALAERFEFESGVASPRQAPEATAAVFVGGERAGVSASLSSALQSLSRNGAAADHPNPLLVVVSEQGRNLVSYAATSVAARYRDAEGSQLSVLGTILLWAHLLVQVPDPAQLIGGTSLLALLSGRRVSGLSGGASASRAAIPEVELARALGVPRIAWTDLDTDRDARERSAVLDDALPGPTDDVLPLLADRMSVRAWLREQPSDASSLGGPLASPRQFTRERIEQIAEHLHHAYVEDQRAHGRMETDPALAPWSRLTPALRASNLAAARDWLQKLDAIDPRHRSVFAANDNDGSSDAPDRQAVLDLLAELEHGRYVVERLTAGWKFGDRRVALQQTHTLVPWSDLPGAERDKDRRAVLVCAESEAATSV